MKTVRLMAIGKLVGSALVAAATLVPLPALAGVWSAVAMDCTPSSSNGVSAATNSALIDKLDFGAGRAVSLKGTNVGWVTLRCNVTTGDDYFRIDKVGMTFVDEHGSPYASSRGTLASQGAVAMQLFQLNNATGARSTILSWDSHDARTRYTSAAQQVLQAFPVCQASRLNFRENSYYVEITISRSVTTLNPKFLSVQLFQEDDDYCLL